MAEVSYTTAMDVNMSWDSIKRKPDYQAKAGELIMVKLIELDPEIRAVFKFTADEDITANPSFQTHANAMVDMIDCAVSFLGPDLEALADEFKYMGTRHSEYGVKKAFLPKMADAVVHAMTEMLGSRFHENDKKAWKEVFSFMISKMSADMSA